MGDLFDEPPTFGEVTGTLLAIRSLLAQCWPDEIPDLRTRSMRWTTASLPELRDELTQVSKLLDQGSRKLRLFWKLAPGYRYRGLNRLFASDAGHSTEASLYGLTDFSPEVTWQQQASKYRADDEDVVRVGEARPYILERQRSVNGVIWMHTAKAPIKLPTGRVIGMLGMYEILTESAAARLHAKLQRAMPE